MTAKGRLDAFSEGLGVEPITYACAECGYTSENRKNFRRSDTGDFTCTTGHYTKGGELKRQKNAYARPV